MSMIINLSQMRKYEVKPILGPFTSMYVVIQNHIKRFPVMLGRCTQFNELLTMPLPTHIIVLLI